MHHKQLGKNISINKICPIGISSQAKIKQFVGSNNQIWWNCFHQIHYYIWNITWFSNTSRTNRGRFFSMPHSYQVLYLYLLAVFKNLAELRVILDMAYMYMRQPWSGTIALCYVVVHHHVGHACWDGILQGLSTTCTQLSSWQVRIFWYPISIRSAGRCRLNWVGLSFNLQAAVNFLWIQIEASFAFICSFTFWHSFQFWPSKLC